MGSSGESGSVAASRILCSPVRLEFGNPVPLEELGAPTLELRPAPLPRPEFSGQGSVDVGFDRRVEEGIEAVEVLLGDRVELVVVAAGASGGQSQPHRRQRGGALHGALDAVHLDRKAAFAIVQGVPVEAGCHALLEGGAGQQIPRDLLDREPVESEVPVERVNHPVAPAPGERANVVRLIAVALAETGLIEPVERLHLTAVRRCEQPLGGLLVGLPAALNPLDLVQARGKSGQIQTETPQQSGRRGVRTRLDSLLLQAGGNKAVNRIANPRCGVNARDGSANRPFERPVGLGLGLLRGDAGILGPWCALIDPPGEKVDVGLGQPVRSQRHHRTFRCGPDEHPDKQTAGSVPRADCGTRLASLHSVPAIVEPQAGRLDRLAMAPLTALTQDRLDVATEVDIGRLGARGQCAQRKRNGAGNSHLKQQPARSQGSRPP